VLLNNLVFLANRVCLTLSWHLQNEGYILLYYNFSYRRQCLRQGVRLTYKLRAIKTLWVLATINRPLMKQKRIFTFNFLLEIVNFVAVIWDFLLTVILKVSKLRQQLHTSRLKDLYLLFSFFDFNCYLFRFFLLLFFRVFAHFVSNLMWFVAHSVWKVDEILSNHSEWIVIAYFICFYNFFSLRLWIFTVFVLQGSRCCIL